MVVWYDAKRDVLATSDFELLGRGYGKEPLYCLFMGEEPNKSGHLYTVIPLNYHQELLKHYLQNLIDNFEVIGLL